MKALARTLAAAVLCASIGAVGSAVAGLTEPGPQLDGPAPAPAPLVMGALPRGVPADTVRIVRELGVGEASWYGPGFHGRLTANGETYDQEALTCAHRSLPFDTLLRVTRVESGETVVVRVNDRGPYIGERILDLSKGAARELDMLHVGVDVVRLEVLDPAAVSTGSLTR